MKITTENKLRKIEKRIDQNLDRNIVFSYEKNMLMISTLMHYEISRGRRHKKYLVEAISEIPEHILMFQSHVLECGSFMISNKCKNIKHRTPNNIWHEILSNKKKQKRIFNFQRLLMSYVLFETGCKMFSRGVADVEIEKKRIRFIANNDIHLMYLLYEQKRIGSLIYRNKARYALPKISKVEIRRLSRILNKWFHSTSFLPPFVNIPEYVILELAIDAKKRVIEFQEIPTNWNLGSYSLNDYRRLWFYIYLKCSISLHFLDMVFPYENYPFIYIQKETDWIKEISEGTELDIQKTKELLNDITFNDSYSSIGIRIQPFVRICEDLLALSPTLVDVSMYDGNMLEYQSKINKKIYDNLSQQKESILINEIRKLFRCRPGILLKDKIEIRKNGNVLTDIDLILLEKEKKSLYLIQIKWPLRPKDEFDLFKKSEEIIKAFDQAIIAELYIKENILEFTERHFKDFNNRVENIFSFVIARDNIGGTDFNTSKIPIVDYEAFYSLVNNLALELSDIYQILLNYEWLPKKGVDFEVINFSQKLFGYTISIPAANEIKSAEN